MDPLAPWAVCMRRNKQVPGAVDLAYGPAAATDGLAIMVWIMPRLLGRLAATHRHRPTLVSMIVAGRLDPAAYPSAQVSRPWTKRPLDYLGSSINNIDLYTTEAGTRAATTAFNRAELRREYSDGIVALRSGRRLCSGLLCGPALWRPCAPTASCGTTTTRACGRTGRGAMRARRCRSPSSTAGRRRWASGAEGQGIDRRRKSNTK